MLSQHSDILIRPLQYGDWDAVEPCCVRACGEDNLSYTINPDSHLKPFHCWYGPLRILALLVNRPTMFGAFLAERENRLQGTIQISPFNRTRSTWRVDRVSVLGGKLEPADLGSSDLGSNDLTEAGRAIALPTPLPEPSPPANVHSFGDIGSLLLRHCMETTWEARTWLLEVNVNDKQLLALYRQNGFQPLAHMTYWEIAPSQLQQLAEREPDLPNLLPVSNADAQLLYQLDTMSMPPLVRQVFDRHMADFKSSLFSSLLQGLKNWFNHTEVVSGYVFEPQRKAAIGYFQVQLCRNGSRPHQAQLTVNPAYTWLYPELMSQMARITRDFPAQSLQLASSDYQPEREEYLERLGASRIAHTLMMSRSVWHKVRESKLGALENLQLPEVLQGLKPARKPIPSRIILPIHHHPGRSNPRFSHRHPQSLPKATKPGQPMLDLSSKTDLSDPPPEGPCC